jgi:DHA2 family multidrug resistance protein
LNLRLFKDRNFSFGTFIITVQGIMLFSTTSILPIFTQTLLGYDAFTSGMCILPRGLGSMLSALIVGRVIGKVNVKLLLFIGFSLLTVSTFSLSLFNVIYLNLIIPLLINGLS